MSKLNQVFVTDELPEGGSFDLLPNGDYDAKIASVDLKDTKDGTGKYLNIRYDITGPTHQGRAIFGMINIMNKSQAAEEIGRGQLGSLLRAIGLAKVEDTDELIGHDVKIKVKTDPAKDGYDAKNTVSGWALIGATPSTEKKTTPALPSWKR